MSKKQKKTSGVASGHEERSSVYDFLYHDPRRIGSFLSQFDPHGHIQSLTHSQSVTEAAGEKGVLASRGSIPAIASVAGTAETTESESVVDGLSKTFDPLWANALSFFDYLEQRDLLRRNIHTAEIGQFVLCSGTLVVGDTDLIQKIYQSPHIISKTLNTIDPNTGQKKKKEDVDVDLMALSILEPQIQAYLHDDDSIVFCNLKADGMITSASDLAMKYGVVIDGNWNMLGIKDANPEYDRMSIERVTAILKTRHSSVPFISETIDLLTRVRLWVGRPVYCHGITPLAIFREIGR